MDWSWAVLRKCKFVHSMFIFTVLRCYRYCDIEGLTEQTWTKNIVL